MSEFRLIVDNQKSVLQICVFREEYHILRQCLKKRRVDVNNGDCKMSFMRDIVPTNGWTALHVSALKGDKESAQILLKFGANVNSRTTSQGYTPLHVAVLCNHEVITRLLIRFKADLNAKDYENKTPLERCLRSQILPIILIKSGADYQFDESFEKHPLIFRAIDKKNLNLVEFLAKHQMRGVDFNNRTPVEYAMNEFPECVPALIASGKQIYFLNPETGLYPIHLMVEMNVYYWIELMAQQKCDPNAANFLGNRPLHIAVMNDCYPEIGLTLLSMGANPNFRNNKGFTPMFYAIELGKKEFTQLFVDYKYRMTRSLCELQRTIELNHFECALILLKNIKSIDKSILFDSEPIVWYFVKKCVGLRNVDNEVMKACMERIVELSENVNTTIDSIFGSLAHYLIYADYCTPTPCLQSLFEGLVGSLKYNIEYEFEPVEHISTKTGELITVDTIAANGSALSFALELARSAFYSEQLIRLGADYSKINWNYLFFAPEKTISLKMLFITGCPFPDSFRRDSNPIYDESIGDHQVEGYVHKLSQLLKWMEDQKKRPLSLKQITRNVIRKEIGSKGLRQLQTKGTEIFKPEVEAYPLTLKNYLLFI